ncbi:MAG: hypothetical protein ACI4WG_03075 [Erysipelotrichaceae bacterium]
MKKSYLCLLSLALAIFALTESINDRNLLSYGLILLALVCLFLYDQNFYKKLHFNKADVTSLLVQLPLMLFISALLKIDVVVVGCICVINLKILIEIKAMSKADCLYYLNVIFFGFVLLLILMIAALVVNTSNNYLLLLYSILCIELFIPFVLSFISYKFL